MTIHPAVFAVSEGVGRGFVEFDLQLYSDASDPATLGRRSSMPPAALSVPVLLSGYKAHQRVRLGMMTLAAA